MFNVYANQDKTRDDRWIHKKRHWSKKEAIMIADSIFEDLNTSFDEVKVTQVGLTETDVYRRSQCSQYWT
jgi:hypothetical protein